MYDATEIETQKSKDRVAQRFTCKQHYSVTVQIGCDPAGNITSVSDAYGGSISDKDLFSRSGVVNKLQEGYVDLHMSSVEHLKEPSLTLLKSDWRMMK